jgi:hypothetical protein
VTAAHPPFYSSFVLSPYYLFDLILLGSVNISKKEEKGERSDSIDCAKEIHYHNDILY